jgi:hypothetical protein
VTRSPRIAAKYKATDVTSGIDKVILYGKRLADKDKYIESASPAASSSLFPEWKEPRHVYYKVRTSVLAPLNFKESRDEGTVAVRYVVQAKDDFKKRRTFGLSKRHEAISLFSTAK